jgi:hypothetical protein
MIKKQLAKYSAYTNSRTASLFRTKQRRRPTTVMYCDHDAIGYLMSCVYTLDDTTLYPQEWKVSYQLDQQTNHNQPMCCCRGTPNFRRSGSLGHAASHALGMNGLGHTVTGSQETQDGHTGVCCYCYYTVLYCGVSSSCYLLCFGALPTFLLLLETNHVAFSSSGITLVYLLDILYHQ